MRLPPPSSAPFLSRALCLACCLTLFAPALPASDPGKLRTFSGHRDLNPEERNSVLPPGCQ
jgi:hypothetical protein